MFRCANIRTAALEALAFRWLTASALCPACAVFNDQLGAYQPYGKEWIKQRVFARLKQQIDGQ